MKTATNLSLTKLFTLSKKRRTLDSIAYLLEWDQETFMPMQGADFRSQQLKLMAHLVHQEKTSKEFSSLLSEFIDLNSGSLKQQLNTHETSLIHNWYRDWRQASKLPIAFVEKFAEESSKSIHIWAEARKHNDFNRFYPHFTKMIDLSCQKAEYLGIKTSAYDTLLDLFEPEMTSEQLDALFIPLKSRLKSLLKQSSKVAWDLSCLKVEFPESKQLAFGKILLKKMGCDPNFSRLDISTHPFSTTLHLTDTRMTTRIATDNLLECLSAILHEGGHSLYETQFNPEFWGTPLTEAASYGSHESQSRFWETIIGQSYSFWEGFYPTLLEYCPALQSTPLKTFYKAVNAVKPGLIRIQADEISYCLHIFIRYEIEKGLMNKTLKPKEVPDLWNALYKEDLGLDVPSYALGCLQDIHWSMGGFGYFPTYALGNIFAGAFFQTLKKQLPDYTTFLKHQDLKPIASWLKENIHVHGRLFTPKKLVEHVTGQPMNTEGYLSYLEKKYLDLFKED